MKMNGEILNAAIEKFKQVIIDTPEELVSILVPALEAIQAEIEYLKLVDNCERCGEEVTTKRVGDEAYRNCPNCGTGINQ